MVEVLVGSMLISLLHTIIPSHWLPVIVIGRQKKWTLSEILEVSFFITLAHAISTIGIGLVLGFIGKRIAVDVEQFTHYIIPGLLVLIGLMFLYRHHTHQHAHMNLNKVKNRSKRNIILTLATAMFLSPCMEIETYFLMAGAISRSLVLFVSFTYFFTTIIGVLVIVRITYKGLLKFDSHKLEHNAGIIGGWTLILTGIFSFFVQ